MYKIKFFFRELFQADAIATFFNYVVKILLNPIIVLLIPVFLTENYQGYWYTFGSIAALTTFADLGFTSIMTQYTAHEYTYLKLEKETGEFIGADEKIGRMSSLFRFVVRWVCAVLLVAVVIIMLVGFIMFSGNDDGVEWLVPWIFYVFATVYNFASEIGLSFYEGCNQFAKTQKFRAISSISHCLATIGLLTVGAGLYALSIPLFIKGSIAFISLWKKFGVSIRQMQRTKIDSNIPWAKEIIPLMGRYSISWASGYFASQIYNPLTFSLYGAAAAGRVGYSLSIIQAIYTVANVWSLISMPKYNMAVEKKEWKKMDSLLKRNITYSAVIYGLGILALYITQWVPVISKVIWGRIVSLNSVMILALSYAAAMVIYAMAIYLRAHKQEPFMVVSVLSGGISAILTFIFAKFSGLGYIFVGLFLSEVIVLPVGIYILKNFRSKWHVADEES